MARGDHHRRPGIPSAACITANAHALARYAAICQAAGLVPIVEPEVLMDGDHSIDRCEEVSEWTLRETFAALASQRVVLEHMVLKPSMVISGKDCAKQAGVQEVAVRTLRTLKRDGAGGGAWHCLPVRRAERRARDRASGRDEQDRRARPGHSPFPTAGRCSTRRSRRGRAAAANVACRAARAASPRAHERAGDARPIPRRPGKRTGQVRLKEQR